MKCSMLLTQFILPIPATATVADPCKTYHKWYHQEAGCAHQPSGDTETAEADNHPCAAPLEGEPSQGETHMLLKTRLAMPMHSAK